MSYTTIMKCLLMLLICWLTLNLSAQDKPITGTILDAETRDPLPFASIMVTGQHKGTVSNSEGRFVLGAEGIAPDDTVSFSYMGYETLKIKAAQLRDMPVIYMYPTVLPMQEVRILSVSMSAEEIIEQVNRNYGRNHAVISSRQRIFFHRYEKTPFSDKNQVILKKTNFAGLDRTTFDELLDKLPREFIEYYDAVLDLYNADNNHKLVPLEAISLEEGSQQAFVKEFERKLSVFLEDIDKSMNDEETYYKFRTGILSYKIGDRNDDFSVVNENRKDTLNYTIKTEQVKNDILILLHDYGSIESKNWEFINSRSKYNYVLKGINVFNDELVYEIAFTPEKGGLFEGVMYISTDTYAILQLDFAFAKGKQSEKFRIFGFGHAMNYKKGRVIFEKRGNGYFVKYIYAQQQESGSVDRNLSIIKKQKRFLIDKELNEIKLDVQLALDTESFWEVLILDRGEISHQQFEAIRQPSVMKFKKEYVYTPEMWNNRSVIAPASELKKYKRK